MKTRVILVVGLVLLFLPGPAGAGNWGPHTIGGITLGGELSGLKNRLEMDTALPIRHMESLKEVEVKRIPGFKSGLVYYTTCMKPSRIVRIKLKYEDSSRRFYETLLEKFKMKFGQPTEWRGDPFRVIIAWKWSFTDSENNNISLILQHNIKDAEEKMGNVVKMTMTNLYAGERVCFEMNHPGGVQEPLDAGGAVNWDDLVPK